MAGREEPDVAVFRFTLGIPGFDDALIPRFVGVLGLLLLLVNHVLNQSAYAVGQVGHYSPSPARVCIWIQAGLQDEGHCVQVRAEVLGAGLATLCILTPTVETRLREVAPGRGRKATSGDLEGAVQLFKLDPSLPDTAKQVNAPPMLHDILQIDLALAFSTNERGCTVVDSMENYCFASVFALQDASHDHRSWHGLRTRCYGTQTLQACSF